jgi:sugar (pentulose or hexulose) kinase
MQNTERIIAFATLDIGTSQIKMGVYCPALSAQIILINSLTNELIYGSAGEVRANYNLVRDKCFKLFKELGIFLKSNNIQVVHVGICGHVSSLLEWNKLKGTPPEKPFPIWLDTASFDSLDEYNDVMGDGKSKRIIGTFMPAGTNWLFTKLLHRKKAGFTSDSIFMQVGDAIFYELCGEYKTHFSSQISMVNYTTKAYAPELLNHLEIDESCLPAIDNELYPIADGQMKLFGLPGESFVYPAMADLYTSLFGLRLNDKEGFMLANTSEQAGAFYKSQPTVLNNFLGITFNNGYVNYGSTNTGGNVLGWLLSNILNKEITPQLLEELTAKASKIDPRDTPIILPYLQGERAPLWNSKLTASILELNSSHTEVHLYRAVLESIAFARRQCFEEIGIDDLHLVKIGGGSSKNNLWNVIRATVLNKPVAVADEKELSMAGLIYYIMDAAESTCGRPVINFDLTDPNHGWLSTYDVKYARFINYQKLLS